jgi:S1-C subfamily serine protease
MMALEMTAMRQHTTRSHFLPPNHIVCRSSSEAPVISPYSSLPSAESEGEPSSEAKHVTKEEKIPMAKIYASIVIVLIIGLSAGYMMGIYGSQAQVTTLSSQLSDLEGQISSLKTQVVDLQSGSSSIVYTIASLNSLYESVKGSVVTIQGLVAESSFFGRVTYSEVLGSGFVVNLTREPLIVTNYHVIDGMVNGSVTFINGESYAFTVVGKDKYSDLAILEVDAPEELLVPLTVVSSKTVNVGDSVIAIGNPYGLQSTLTTGTISQIDRAIEIDATANYELANIIQISTPINPGNSGGPLLDSQGRVVGITNAIIDNSNDVGFAVSSDAILSEIQDLVTKGFYSHSYIGLSGTSLDYLTSNAAGLNTTRGVLIQSVISGSPAAAAGLIGGTRTVTVGSETVKIGGDVILQVDDLPVRTMDDLLSYLEESTVPGQTISLTVLRGGDTIVINVVLGGIG